MINLKTLPQCGSCGTIVKTHGLCNYCLNEKEKISTLVTLSRLVLSDYRYKEVPKKEKARWMFRGYACSVCGKIPEGRHKGNYLTHRPEGSICLKCRKNGCG
jgi:hypothetical protein